MQYSSRVRASVADALRHQTYTARSPLARKAKALDKLATAQQKQARASPGRFVLLMGFFWTTRAVLSLVPASSSWVLGGFPVVGAANGLTPIIATLGGAILGGTALKRLRPRQMDDPDTKALRHGLQGRLVDEKSSDIGRAIDQLGPTIRALRSSVEQRISDTTRSVKVAAAVGIGVLAAASGVALSAGFVSAATIATGFVVGTAAGAVANEVTTRSALRKQRAAIETLSETADATKLRLQQIQVDAREWEQGRVTDSLAAALSPTDREQLEQTVSMASDATTVSDPAPRVSLVKGPPTLGH